MITLGFNSSISFLFIVITISGILLLLLLLFYYISLAVDSWYAKYETEERNMKVLDIPKESEDDENLEKNKNSEREDNL